MATKPVLDERRLLKALAQQGFTVEPTTNGYRVIAPNGGGTSGFHSSVFGSDANHGYLNQMAQLAGIGFDINKVDAGTNGHREQWKAEREAIDAMVADTNAKADAETREANALAAAHGVLALAVDGLKAAPRELYDAVVDNPGQSPRAYADALHIEKGNASQRASILLKAGVIEATGATTTRRLWPIGQVPDGLVDTTDHSPRTGAGRIAQASASKNGRPSAGPVRISHQDPADARVRFKRMGQKATRLKEELETIVVAMVQQYEEQEDELEHLRRKLRKLEDILGRAVDQV